MNIPLFNDHILTRLTTALTTYNQQYHILTVLIAAILLPWLFYRLFRKCSYAYPPFFPAESHAFDRRDKLQITALSVLSAAVVFYIIILYQSEMSFFEDFDSMHWSGFQTSHQSPDLLNAFHRFFPLGHAEWLFLYTVSANFYLLNLFLVGQLIFCLWLFYRLLDFIPVTTRLAAATLLLLCPAVFTSFNGHIFTERNGIMFLLLGLLFFKKYNLSRSPTCLWFSILCFNLMLYFKEINILLLLGFLAFSFMWNLWHEKITLAHFKHPLRLICSFPFEFLLFTCCLIFTILFDMHIPLNDPHYPSRFIADWSDILIIYAFELLLGLIAFIYFVCRLLHKKAALWPDGFLCGAFLLAGWIISCRFAHFEPYVRKSYISAIAAAYFIIYLTAVIKNLKPAKLFFIPLLGAAIAVNLWNLRLDHGKYFHQAADFLAGHPEAVYLDFQTDNYWFHRSFYRAVAYYHPGHKFSVKPYAFEKYDDINLVLDNLRPLEKGDLYLHYNGLNRKPPFFPKERKYRPVYENRVITVYEVL